MSQYSIKHVGDSGRVYRIMYGYDRPLSEYFIQVWDDKADEDCPIFAVGSRMSINEHPDFPGKQSWSNGELLELFEKFGVPEAHRSMLALDQPF